MLIPTLVRRLHIAFFLFSRRPQVSVVDNQCFIQAALLYTNHEAERRIRVLTYSIVASNNHAELVQSVDPQTTAAILSHVAVDRAVRSSLQEARNFLTHTCTQQVQNSSHITEQVRGGD